MMDSTENFQSLIFYNIGLVPIQVGSTCIVERTHYYERRVIDDPQSNCMVRGS